MPKAVHFEIPADKPERAIKFYEKVFGWKITKWEGKEDYWLIKAGEKDEPGINGGLSKRTDPEAHVINTIDVPSIDEFIEKIKKNGGKITTPKINIPGVGDIAYFKDPEGNIFGIMERDKISREFKEVDEYRYMD